MRYRRFGKTNRQVSVFSLGMMRCLASEETAIQTVQQAVLLGINHLETALSYGNSEKFLGAALQSDLPMTREELIVSTKMRPAADAETMRQQINQSLERLNLEYIDCLAIHGINTEEHLALVQQEDGCMKAVQEAIALGKIRHLGFSTHGSSEIITAAINTDLFEFVNLHYYYFSQRHRAVIELASQKDLGIFIISPADKGGMLYTPSATLQELCHPLTPLELGNRFLLSDPRIATLSVGAAHPEELLEPLQTADRDFPLTVEEKAVFDRLETHLAANLGTDLCSQCHACLPCPESINIPEVLRLRNLAVGYDMTAYGEYRYRMFENAGHWFPGRKGNRCTDCGDCLPKCPQNLNIPELLRDTHNRLHGSEGRRLWE